MTGHRAVILAAATAMAATVALAAEPPAAPSKTEPEPTPQQKLGYFAGKWTGESEVKQNPFMPAGKYTSKDTCEWFEGGFALLCRGESSGPAGTVKTLGISGYSAEEKVYTFYGIDSTGSVSTTVAKGTVAGNTWTYNDQSMMGGKMVMSRYIITQFSPSSYSFKWEAIGDGGKWISVMEGKQTKAP